MCIVVADDAVYTASRDRSLKRWKPTLDGQRWLLKAEVEIPLGEQCWSLAFVEQWLFCGLGDGRIQGFSKSGEKAELSTGGHAKRVTCILQHQHVLLSGGHDASVRCWQASPGASQPFGCTHTIQEGMPGAVQCMAVLKDHLWVGTSNGIGIVELSSLRVIQSLAPKKYCIAMLVYEGCMIVLYSDGMVIIFDAQGAEKLNTPPTPAGPATALVGIASGPRVLIGHARGQVTAVGLPMFNAIKTWQTFDKCKVQSICGAPGTDGIFIIGGENGNLQLWKRDEI